MISWIQRYFQHHFRTIFAFLLASTIISFIFTIGAAPGIGRADRRAIERRFFSYNLNLAEDQQRLVGDAGLSANLQVGGMGLEAEQVQNYAFQRAATLELAAAWHIPAATNAEITEAIKNLRMFAGPDGQFDAKAYATFRDNLKTNPRGLTEADVARVIGDDVRVNKVNALLSGPGYVLAADVKNQLVRSDTSWTLSTASADYAAYQPEIKPSDLELTQFFEQAGGRYEIPPRLSASYADFPALSYFQSINVTDAEVRAFYDANPSRFPKPADPKAAAPDVTKPTDPAAAYAAVRGQVETSLKFERAQKQAVRAASDLALALFEAKANTIPAVDAFLANRKVTAKTLAPFTRDTGPAELGGSTEIATEGFRLNASRVASDAISTPTGSVVLFWKETLPARKPLFTEVKDKATSDYVENERRKRFVELGRKLKGQIETRLKAGEAFEAAATAASTAAGLKLEAKTTATFTLRNPPPDADRSIFGALERMGKGQVSDMIVNPDKGIFVYTADKKAPDLSDANPRLAETRAQLASFSTRMGATAYVSEMVETELKRSEPKVK
ncbi:MAG: peptidyl-prolyl cis-trans isomerase [Opitutus sp.]|nr:peptidyl-prolyl cis-trans isomerase [Opitutus sp.]